MFWATIDCSLALSVGLGMEDVEGFGGGVDVGTGG